MTKVINPYAVRHSSSSSSSNSSMKADVNPSEENSRNREEVPTAPVPTAKAVNITPKPMQSQQHLSATASATASTTAEKSETKPALVTHVKATVTRVEVVSKPLAAATVQKKGGSFRQQLQQEVAQLKQQQKLIKERLQWQKEQRTLLKKQQKQQQKQQQTPDQLVSSANTSSFVSGTKPTATTTQLLSITQQPLAQSMSPQVSTIATTITKMPTGALADAPAAADIATETTASTPAVVPSPPPTLPNTAPASLVTTTIHPRSSSESRHAGQEAVGDDSTRMMTTALATTTTAPHPPTAEAAATAAEMHPLQQQQQQQQQHLLQQPSFPPDYYHSLAALYPFGYTSPHPPQQPQPWSAPPYQYYNIQFDTLLRAGGNSSTSYPYPPHHFNHLTGYPQNPQWMPEQLTHPTMPPHYFMHAADALQWQPPTSANGTSFAFQPQQYQPRLLSPPSHSRQPQPLWKDPVPVAVFTQKPLYRTDGSSHRTRNMKRSPNHLLAANPCQAPSPFARTHELLPSVIRLIRHHATQPSFGTTLQLDMQSALVDPDIADSLFQETRVTGTVKTASATKTTIAVPETNLLLIGGETGDPKRARSATTTTDLAGGTAVTTIHTTAAAESLFPNPTVGATALLLPPPLQTPHQRRRRRRCRVFFSVVKVLDPSQQNERQQQLQQEQQQRDDDDFDDEKQLVQLQKDDILLTIAGTTIAGLSFAQACALFQKCSTEPPDRDGMIYCEVTVARRKVVEPPAADVFAKPAMLSLGKGKVPLGSVNDLALESPSLVEQLRWVNGILQAVTDPLRLLGGPMVLPWNRSAAARHGSSDDDDDDQRYQFHSSTTWNIIRNEIESTAQQKAIQYWKSQWIREPANIALGNREYLTDAQRSILRAAPRRPDNCCRCSSQEHQYVNDIHCPLYSNLRSLLDKNDAALIALDDATEVAKRNKALAKSLPRDLNVVEKAFKDRFVRTKVEQQAIEVEARFVAKMRDIQVAQCHQAIFAPSLSVMVLSAVVELQSEFEGKDLPPLLNHHSSTFTCQPVAAADMANCRKAEEEDSDDGDNVPLAALTKRPSIGKDDDNGAAIPNAANKRQRGNTPVRLQFLAKLVQTISQRWGHVFQEASNEEYAWRWELYHGGQETSENGSNWDGNTNPRAVGSCSMENVRFIVDDSVVANLEKDDQSPLKLEALKILAHVLSPERTGVYDELLALIRTGVLSVDERGIPALTKEWWSLVDLLLLDNMYETWGVHEDVRGWYGVAKQVRTTLHRKWVRTDYGWAFAKDKEDVIFDFEDFDEWRTAFEDKQRAQSDGLEGVGRFG